MEIVNDRGEVCPPARFDAGGALLNAEEAIGEIVSRGAAARFEGYYNNPGAGRDRLRDGDFWTGDLGYRDADGFFWYAGRTADWLRVDSENFAAASVERILLRFPGVTAAAVYAVPDPVTGDQVMAALECPGRRVRLRRVLVLPRRAARPGHEAGAAAYPGHRPPAGNGDPQDQQACRCAACCGTATTRSTNAPVRDMSLMTADRKGALEAEFARHGREQFLRLY